jgi:MYXO-CTERM domain-containing protein
VPGRIGWILVAWGPTSATAMPASPVWALAVIGALIALGERRRR